MKLVSKSAILLALCGCLTFTSCASVRERIPFLGNKEEGGKKAKDEGRIAILGLEDELKADEDAKNTAISVPASVNLSEWPNVGGIPTNAPQNLAGDGELSILWRSKIGVGASQTEALIAAPVISNNAIYTIDTDLVVHASSLDNGKKIWSKRLNKVNKKGFMSKVGTAVGGGIAYGEGKVFISSGFGEILALDANNGNQVWNFKTNSPVHTAPLVNNGKLYVVSVDSVLWALDANTGATLWNQSSIPETARVLSSSSSAISGETIVTPFASGELIASLIANGRKLWSEGLTRAGSGTSLSSINDIAGRPAIVGGVVYAGSQSGIVAAIDLRTGIKIWEKSIPTIQTPWVSGDLIYVVSTDSQLICLKRETGAIIWIKQLAAYENEKKRKKRITWTGPIMVAGHLVLASSTGQIGEYDPSNGNLLRAIKTKEQFLISPAYKDGTLYFYSNQGDIYALK